jgi:peptidoglycan/LPS O-acetylase OafA/YrhL
MNKTIGIQLAVYGLALAGLGYFVHHLAPKLASTTLITGLAGGALCLLWGVWAMAGWRRKGLALLTLAVVTFTLLSQTVLTWGVDNGEAPGHKTAALVMGVMLVLSLGMLTRVAYAGVVFEGQPATPASSPGTKPRGPGGGGR